MPEFLDDDGPPEVLARETLALLADTPVRRAQAAALERLTDIMTLPVGAHPSNEAAEIVLEAAGNGWGRPGKRLG